ncbi:MAG: dephospho-CoA kinase [Nanohaloarchaea archaeon]|nr:dephospho-CoA kinase [Candidatus Nanohaloarchaea archaeon]
MSKGLYAFSGDPVTRGHRHVIERILKAHPDDELVIGIGVNPDKNYLFTLDERTDMACKYLSDLNVEVAAFEGMLTDYACENGFDVVYRGIRDEYDARDELNLFNVLRDQNSEFEMFFIPAHYEMTKISSSNAKAIAKEHGSIDSSVSSSVKEAIYGKYLSQYPIGLTGVSGAGKSYWAKEIKNKCNESGIPIHHIDLDVLGHQILEEATEDLYVKTRLKIIETFDVESSGGFVDRKALGAVVFDNPENMTRLNEIMYKPMMIKITRERYGADKKGLLLIDGALIAEFGWMNLSNNNTILVSTDEKTQESRLFNSGLDHEQIGRRKESQYTENLKREKLLDAISKDNNGTLWEIDNSFDSNPDIDGYFKDMIFKVDRWGELRFSGLWNRIGADGTPDEEYRRLVRAYSEPHRHYHTLDHIVSGLDELWGVRELLDKPDEVEFAWWFHDSVYKRQSNVNEIKSAEAASNLSRNVLLGEDFATDVKRLVLDTAHNKVPETFEGEVIADIDTLVFGTVPEIFDDYEFRIGKEYSWADPDEFKTKRSEILLKFLERSQIYYTDVFEDAYGAQARANLERVLVKLDV